MFIIRMCIFLPSSEFSVVLDISDSDYNINLPIGRFSHEGFLISKHSSILHVLLNSQSHLPGFYTLSFL